MILLKASKRFTDWGIVTRMNDRFIPRRRWSLSPLTVRIMAVNLSALLILSLGFLFTVQYERQLIRAELEGLLTTGHVTAAALSAFYAQEDFDHRHMQEFVEHLVSGNTVRVRVFSPDNEIIADSHRAVTKDRGVIAFDSLLPALYQMQEQRRQNPTMTMLLSWLPTRLALPRFEEEALAVFDPGQAAGAVWRDRFGTMVLGLSMPIHDAERNFGSIIATKPGFIVDLAVQEVQVQLLEIALWVLTVTVLVSVYLAMEITYPIMRLANAAQDVRRSLAPREDLVRLAARDDEIGLLSESFLDMTNSLNERMDAIESFAADVAHEIKNPLASVRSAIETLSRIQDAQKREQLLEIIAQDIIRIDRLITDISAASRLDSELRHAERVQVDLRDLLKALVESMRVREGVQTPFMIALSEKDSMTVHVNDGQISQVFINLLQNAVSFAPPKATVAIGGYADKDYVVTWVENEGPPIPESKLEKIFERFYSERPSNEKFGLHSGLGLSISRQIIKAHGGTIYAENKKDAKGQHKGVRFTVLLPHA